MLRTAHADSIPEGAYLVVSTNAARVTKLDLGSQQPNWAHYTPGLETSDAPSVSEDARKFQVVRREPIQERIEDRLREVEGSVISVDGDIVHCELLVRGAVQVIDLHREFFEFEPQFGAPFSLSMRVEGGYRAPVAKRRERHPERNAGFVARGNELLQDF